MIKKMHLTKKNGTKTIKPNTVAYLACTVQPAHFDEDRVVIAESVRFGRVAVQVRGEEVLPKEKPAAPIEGKVRVWVVDRLKEGILVELPEETISATSGSRIVVPEQKVEPHS